MKKTLLIACSLFFLNVSAQDHFSGINTSQRVGLLNIDINPSELSNLTTNWEFHLFSTSINASNDQFGVQDIVEGKDIMDSFLNSTEPINTRVDAQIVGPGFAFKVNKWAFGFSSKAYTKFNIIEVSPQIGTAINDSKDIVTPVDISSDYNQRVNETSWGEVGLSISRILYENDKNKFSGGATLKLLFPGSYANIGISQFKGTIRPNTLLGTTELTDTHAFIDLTYSGNMNNLFSGNQDYQDVLFGKFNGVAADFGLNYLLKDDKDSYKLKTGLSVRNIGEMTFNESNNSTSSYELLIQGSEAMDLDQFSGNSFEEIKNIFANSPYVTETKAPSNEIKVMLPKTINAYVDVKIIPKLYVTLYSQQKIGDDQNNNQVTTQNILSLTPRFSTQNYEVFSTWAKNEISGTTGGLGFRIWYLYMGSSSILTSLNSNAKQADVYFGVRFGV